MLCLPCSVICTEHGEPNMAVLLCKTCEQDHKPAAKLLVLTVSEQYKAGEPNMCFHCMQLDSCEPPLPAFLSKSVQRTVALCMST